MSRFSGPQGKGAMHRHRQRLREEAAARQRAARQRAVWDQLAQSVQLFLEACQVAYRQVAQALAPALETLERSQSARRASLAPPPPPTPHQTPQPTSAPPQGIRHYHHRGQR